jgi:hypothetical protein
MFQYGGGMWKEWNDKMQEALLPTQRVLDEPKGSKCEDGSWDPIDEWSLAGGRVYTTAMGSQEPSSHLLPLGSSSTRCVGRRASCILSFHSFHIPPPYWNMAWVA